MWIPSRRIWSILPLFWHSTINTIPWENNLKIVGKLWTGKCHFQMYVHEYGHGPRLSSGYWLWKAPFLCVFQHACMRVYVTEVPYWLLMVESPWSEWWGLEGKQGGWCEWQEWTMEGWRVSEEWGQAPEVQSHQLKQLCGANTGVTR